MPKNEPEAYMARAIALSRRGYPAPNPHVGCVIVYRGNIVGEGFHSYAGGPHAEAVALANAGDRSRGATAYVTLEPCNHFGRTPPCTKLLIESGIKEVVYAVADPNKGAQGGHMALVQAGIEVVSGVLAERAEAVNYRWLTAIRRGTPYVVVKVAIGVDGRIAMSSGESKWITNELARREGRKLRAELGSVLVGAGTVKADNPRLTARVRGIKNQPVRIVLDPTKSLSGEELMFQDVPEALWITSTSNKCRPQVVNGEINLLQMLNDLFRIGITGILVEGGAFTISKFFEHGLVDELALFIGAKVLGSGKTWIDNSEITELSSAHSLTLRSIRKLGSDVNLTYTVDRAHA